MVVVEKEEELWRRERNIEGDEEDVEGVDGCLVEVRGRWGCQEGLRGNGEMGECLGDRKFPVIT